MAYLAYLFRRLIAIILGVALTGYSAWASWTHSGDLIGPLAAVSAAVLLAFTEYAWRDRQRIMAGCLLVLGLAAAAISGSVVLERVSHSKRRVPTRRGQQTCRGSRPKRLSPRHTRRSTRPRPRRATHVATAEGLRARPHRSGRKRLGNGSSKPAPSWSGSAQRSQKTPRLASLGHTRRLSGWSCCWACPCGLSSQPP